MRKLKIAYLLAFAPMLMGADEAQLQSGLVVNTLPICGDTEYLTYTASGLTCTSITGGSLSVPDCKKDDQLLTYSMTGEIGVFSCTSKGSESLSASDVTTINNRYTELVNMETQIRNLESGMRSPAAKYCGQTTGTTTGRITAGGGAVGIAAAAALCAQVANCGTGARMCSVYDMYHSAAVGTITQAQNISKSWVYMASWQNGPGSNEATAGLSDNCGSYTYPTGDLLWRGTAMRWEARNNGEKVLKFYTGATAAAPAEGAGCAETLPIACCK